MRYFVTNGVRGLERIGSRRAGGGQWVVGARGSGPKAERRADRLHSEREVPAIPRRHLAAAERHPEREAREVFGLPGQADAIAFGKVGERRGAIDVGEQQEVLTILHERHAACVHRRADLGWNRGEIAEADIVGEARRARLERRGEGPALAEFPGLDPRRTGLS